MLQFAFAPCLSNSILQLLLALLLTLLCSPQSLFSTRPSSPHSFRLTIPTRVPTTQKRIRTRTEAFTMKSTIIFTLLTLSSSIIAATPPACLLEAVNTEQAPGNLSVVCGSDASKVQSAIASMCTGSNVAQAQSAFISTCSAAGSEVGMYSIVQSVSFQL